MLVMGLVGGPFIGYLATSRQIFQDIYVVGDMFVIYFALGSIATGIASLPNAKLVMRHGMRRLTGMAAAGPDPRIGGSMGLDRHWRKSGLH